MQDGFALIDSTFIEGILGFLVGMARAKQIADGGGTDKTGFNNPCLALELGLHYLPVGHATGHHQYVELIHVGVGGALYLLFCHADGKIPLQPGRELEAEGKGGADDQRKGEKDFPVQ